jgi:hypothetical protein
MTDHIATVSPVHLLLTGSCRLTGVAAKQAIESSLAREKSVSVRSVNVCSYIPGAWSGTEAGCSGVNTNAERNVHGVDGRPNSGAVQKMEVGPPESPGRGRLQTTASCVGKEPRW